jgi:hypothetical protein
MPGRYLPPDHDAGDEATLGGYRAVHGRPPAFDGPDGMPYSVDVASDATGDADRPFGAFLLFLRWRRMGAPGVDAHIESKFIAYAETAEQAERALADMPLTEVKLLLDELVRATGAIEAQRGRRWWDVMRDEAGGA